MWSSCLKRRPKNLTQLAFPRSRVNLPPRNNLVLRFSAQTPHGSLFCFRKPVNCCIFLENIFFVVTAIGELRMLIHPHQFFRFITNSRAQFQLMVIIQYNNLFFYFYAMIIWCTVCMAPWIFNFVNNTHWNCYNLTHNSVRI